MFVVTFQDEGKSVVYYQNANHEKMFLTTELEDAFLFKELKHAHVAKGSFAINIQETETVLEVI